MSLPFVLLPWDSEFFGFAIGRVSSPRLTDQLVADLTTWVGHHAVRCVYFLADACDPATLRLAAESGFDLVDVRVTLGTSAAARRDGDGAANIRDARPDDLATLEAIARTSHRDTRFYADHRFDSQRCDDMYATWIRSSCRGDASFVLVAEAHGQPAGYITGHVDDNRVGRIGLTAVAPAARRQGLGRVLADGALDRLARAGARRVTVVTQARNAAALALYQRCGFHVDRIDLWYHRWFDGDPGR